MQKKAQIVDDITIYIQSNSKQEAQQLLRYLEAILSESENLESIYYGYTDNHMINGSGWLPPENFDLRTRPWYIKAVEEKTLVLTDVFLNASKDKRIITIAKPVFDMNQKLLGVVGADLSIEKIIKLIANQNGNFGYAFLLDGKFGVIAQSENFKNANQQLSDIGIGLAKNYKDQNNDIITIEIDGEKGYVLLTKIENTDLILGTFIPKKIFPPTKSSGFTFCCLLYL